MKEARGRGGSAGEQKSPEVCTGEKANILRVVRVRHKTLEDKDEREAVKAWALHPCQAPPGDLPKKPSSIMTHRFAPVEMPSDELEGALESRLNMTIGPAQGAPTITPPQAQGATNPRVVQERQDQDTNREMLQMMKKVFNDPKPKKKWSNMKKDRICG